MVMVSEGEVSRLYVSKLPVRSKVAVSVDIGRDRARKVGVAVRLRRREAALDANIVDLLWFVVCVVCWSE